MADLKHLFDAAREASTPTSEAIEQVRARLEDLRTSDPDVKRWVRNVGAAAPEEIDALRLRLRALPQRAARRRLAVRTAALVAIAATLLLLVRSSAPPVAIEAERSVDVPLDHALLASQPSPALPVEAVELKVSGDGHATGSARSPRVQWRSGLLEVAVRPNAGVDLEVSTAEARVRVVGTRFAVLRDTLGTRVDVSQGRVAVRCGDQPETHLDAGDVLTCPPVDLPGLLGRVRALELAEAPAAEALLTVDQALQLPAPPLVRGELLATQIRLLLQVGQHPAARAAARTYLDEGHAPRRAELEAFLASPTPPPPEAP